MNAAQQLSEIVTRHGRTIVKDRDRLASLLNDQGVTGRESFVLLTALHDGVPERLTSAGGNVPPEVVRANLVRRLNKDRGIDMEQAAWAVTTWATALGLPHVQLAFDSQQRTNLSAGAGVSVQTVPVGEGTTRVCPFCGSPTATQQCTSCGRNTSASRKICARCGKMAPSADSKCWNCGSTFTSDVWWKILVLIGVFILVFLLNVVLRGT